MNLISELKVSRRRLLVASKQLTGLGRHNNQFYSAKGFLCCVCGSAVTQVNDMPFIICGKCAAV